MATREVEQLQSQLEALQRSHDTLLKSLSASNEAFGLPETPRFQRSATRDYRTGDAAFADTSTLSDDSEDEDESFFVQGDLPAKSFDHEHLREHLKTHEWKEHGRAILAPIITDPGKLSKQSHLFHTGPGPAEDRSHYSHFQVYDVGPDGKVDMVETSSGNNMSKATEIWHSIRNIGQNTEKRTVGRITIAREPSPILFGALHLTLHETFDMDELFQHLVQIDASSAHMHRAFYENRTHQRTFFFKFEYYTVLGDDCTPMEWQRSDKDIDKVSNKNHTHIPLSRCGAVLALALFDENPRRIRNRERRAKTQSGWVQDIWSPYQILQLECFPDWRATSDAFEPGHRYLNGPEAFLHALLNEYKDARKRYDEIYKRITSLITPALSFLFDAELRDQRLFEDKKFTWTRRYFYAHQTLGNVNDSIKSMIDAFEDTFVDEVWEGKSKTLWPLFEESPRNDHWKRRLRLLRLQFEREMKELRILQRENNERRHEIESLQDHLFSGTSIQESRKSVELSDITVQQGRNIKLLTIVNLFFMPLTFVTSVYGMTNMPPDPAPYSSFAITLVAICIPFFSLIGFLSTNFGYTIWAAKTKQIYRWIRPKRDPEEPESEPLEPSIINRTLSSEEGMRLRMGERGDRDAGDGTGEKEKERERRISFRERKPDRESASHPNIKRMVEAMGEGRQSGLARMGTVAGSDRVLRASKDTVVDVKDT
ncbi:hypothetical protein P280DRAFT_174461 [Massarina eburnea CBS 473.64]|uniref:Cora-domain-containing protein n=1 Tax=Massarina eburnea CBS 473.64 TaxID=1395130 RepID=A0A6A6SEB8_9PLEO|nr:hypothetical protein P280DRAFT_174461 [Massarina eburnea CBS 473.64]